jgi:transposase
LGIEVRLLPASYVRAYVKRNKTDAADAEALLEAARCAGIVPVRVKSVDEQALQALHRTRSLWMATRTARINALRGFCREFGIAIAQGARVGLEQIAWVLAEPSSAIPGLIRETMKLLVEEIRLLEARVGQLERELTQTARQSAACTTLLSIPGVGLLTATAMVAATSGNVGHFRDARHFAAWFGLTPKEYSSGSTRRIGRISKRGDRYLRMLHPTPMAAATRLVVVFRCGWWERAPGAEREGVPAFAGVKITKRPLRGRAKAPQRRPRPMSCLLCGFLRIRRDWGRRRQTGPGTRRWSRPGARRGAAARSRAADTA